MTPATRIRSTDLLQRTGCVVYADAEILTVLWDDGYIETLQRARAPAEREEGHGDQCHGGTNH